MAGHFDTKYTRSPITTEQSRLGALGAIADYDPRIEIQGSGPPLVFVPGMDGTGQLFYRQIPRLASRFRVATYALRDGAERMATLVDDLARVIRLVASEGQAVVLVGESFGGALAMSFTLAHQALVRRLVVLNSFPYFGPQHRLHLGRAALRVLPWGAMRLVRRLTAFRMHSRHTHRSEIRYFLAQTKRTTRHGYLGRLRILTEYDVRGRLGEIRVPTLFLAAERDKLIPSVRQGTYMAARVPNATLRVLEGHGHISLIAPDVDLDAILREWERSGRAGR